jgi:hypothetical protein
MSRASMSNLFPFLDDCAELFTRKLSGSYKIRTIDAAHGTERLKRNGTAKAQ